MSKSKSANAFKILFLLGTFLLVFSIYAYFKFQEKKKEEAKENSNKRIELLHTARDKAQNHKIESAVYNYRTLINKYQDSLESEVAKTEIKPFLAMLKEIEKIKFQRKNTLIKKFEIFDSDFHGLSITRIYRHKDTPRKLKVHNEWDEMEEYNELLLKKGMIGEYEKRLKERNKWRQKYDFNIYLEIHEEIKDWYKHGAPLDPPSIKLDYKYCSGSCWEYKVYFNIDGEEFVFNEFEDNDNIRYHLSEHNTLLIKLANAKKAAITSPINVIITQRELNAIRETLELLSLIKFFKAKNHN